ncbi:MAG: hypothetical protein EOP32_26750 [Rhodococcus sp. (in: high G+C Gram-positive bacteria)]|nr:MAG: hypothetical protein EOP32_26750 [Rhodococcus sp. (in: high G+C Gram-positive bacteria)]
MVFADRADAGRRLVRRLHMYRRTDVVVLGLPRGGIPVAVEVTTALNAPLDVIAVGPLGVPHQPELAFGQSASGTRMIDPLSAVPNPPVSGQFF